MGMGDEFALKTVKEIEAAIPTLLGAKTVAELLTAIESKAVSDIDGLLDKHQRQLRDEAQGLVDHGVASISKQMGTILRDDVELAVGNARKAAELLVSKSLDRFSEEAKSLVKELSKAISEQRVSVKVDLQEVAQDAAETARKELISVLPWVAVIAGLMNLAGIAIAWFFARGM